MKVRITSTSISTSTSYILTSHLLNNPLLELIRIQLEAIQREGSLKVGKWGLERYPWIVQFFFCELAPISKVSTWTEQRSILLNSSVLVVHLDQLSDLMTYEL